LRPLTTVDLQAGVEEYEVADLPAPPFPALPSGLRPSRRPAPARPEGMTVQPRADEVGPASPGIVHDLDEQLTAVAATL
jgi:hypothetical protein